MFARYIYPEVMCVYIHSISQSVHQGYECACTSHQSVWWCAAAYLAMSVPAHHIHLCGWVGLRTCLPTLTRGAGSGALGADASLHSLQGVNGQGVAQGHNLLKGHCGWSEIRDCYFVNKKFTDISWLCSQTTCWFKVQISPLARDIQTCIERET